MHPSVSASSEVFSLNLRPELPGMEGRMCQGELHYPTQAKGPVPLVLVVHEWWGMTDHPRSRARRLAEELGVAAVAVDLYGDGKTVDTPPEAGALAAPFFTDSTRGAALLREFVREAEKFSRANGKPIDFQRLYAIGFCFGGTQALNLAREGDSLPGGARLAGAASFHGGLGSSLRFKKGTTTQVLVLNGAADPMVKREDIAALKEDAKSAGVNLRFVDYPGAQHAFTNPKATEKGLKFKMPIAYDAEADRASWDELARMIRHGLPSA